MGAQYDLLTKSRCGPLSTPSCRRLPTLSLTQVTATLLAAAGYCEHSPNQTRFCNRIFRVDLREPARSPQLDARSIGRKLEPRLIGGCECHGLLHWASSSTDVRGACGARLHSCRAPVLYPAALLTLTCIAHALPLGMGVRHRPRRKPTTWWLRFQACSTAAPCRRLARRRCPA